MKGMKMRRTAAISMVALSIAALGSAGPGARAQAPAQPPAITGLAHVAFRVSDLDKEINFLGKLGYEEAFANTSGSRTMEVFVKVNDRQFIELYPQSNPPQPLGWMHACYESDDLNALNALYTSRGFKPTPVRKAASGNLIFSIPDPDGRVTEFTEYMPGSRHTLDQGQHLGEDRVSDALMGFELPARNLDAARQFYTKLGFDAEDAEGSIHLTAPGAPDLRIVLNSTGPTSQPEMLLGVPDARKAADHLHQLGLKVNRQDKLVFVRDPDGNLFVLLETGQPQGLVHKLPFAH
jgi:catechol 2,3-dioxygenase-like lactoylglutathione lyase family enzyme